MTRKEHLVEWHKQKNNLGIARCDKILIQMNTFAKNGRNALLHLFSKKELFGATRYPREVTVSKHSIDLEDEYLGHKVGTSEREDHYQIYFWSIEMGLTEILLVSGKNEGKLSDLICRFAKGSVTHIVIAKKIRWGRFTAGEWESKIRENPDSNHGATDKVMIYSLTERQIKSINDRIDNEELDQFESAEDFTLSHGYFPKKRNYARQNVI